MFICEDCGLEFNEPKTYIETHGLPCPPYEKWTGCPFCGGYYSERKEEE
jgi:hypothetical protein